MSPAQTVALRRVAAAGAPTQVAPATAAVLSERYGFIAAAGTKWAITDKGRGYLERDDYDRRRSARVDQITKESRAWARRVMAWLEAHEYLGFPEHYGEVHPVQQYAEHFAACRRQGLEPVRPRGTLDWIEDDVRMAVALLTDFDAAREKATAKGCGIEVEYTTAPAHPKAKADAAAARPDGTVDLRTYRIARGLDVDRDGAA